MGGLHSVASSLIASADEEVAENRPDPAEAVREARRRSLLAHVDSLTPQHLAAAFLNDYQRIEVLAFQEAVGYWANSYIPGDPAMRLLRARLEAWDRGAFRPVRAAGRAGAAGPAALRCARGRRPGRLSPRRCARHRGPDAPAPPGRDQRRRAPGRPPPGHEHRPAGRSAQRRRRRGGAPHPRPDRRPGARPPSRKTASR